MESHGGVYISTYGCQMNVNDTERMYSLLEMQNYTPVSSPEQADVIIINSCSVREKPVHKVHSEVGRYRTLKEKNPQLMIGVGGCVGQQEKKRLLDDISLLDFVFGTDAIDSLPEIISETRKKNTKIVEARFRHREPYHVDTLVRNPGVSTFVNITKGCDNFCTFCVVPYTRGREKSRPLDQLIKDVRSLSQRGVKEVTLLGQNVNSYKSPCQANFADLLKSIAEDTDIERIRYTTSHPKDFDRQLCEVSQKYREKICDYIHLPVQSGSTKILEDMNRGYSRQDYLEKVEMIREIIPGVIFSTDIIVGFPGESEEDFEQTLSLLKSVEYETLFAFKYSPRPFTKAARFTNQVDEKTKTLRLDRLFKFQDKIAMEKSKKYEGQDLPVLVEKWDEERSVFSGRTTQNKLVHFSSAQGMDDENLIGRTLNVHIHQARPNTFRGELLA